MAFMVYTSFKQLKQSYQVIKHKFIQWRLTEIKKETSNSYLSSENKKTIKKKSRPAEFKDIESKPTKIKQWNK